MAIITSIVVIGILIALAYMFSRAIARCLQVVNTRAEQIAAGDLTGAPLDLQQKDEIQEVAASLQQMQQALRQVVVEAASSSEQVSASAEEVAATAQQTVATSLHLTALGAEAVQDVNIQIEAIAASSKETEASAIELQHKSVEIQAIVGLITQIADQTNQIATLVEEVRLQMEHVIHSVQQEVTNVEQGLMSSKAVQTAFAEIAERIEQVVSHSEQTNNKVDDLHTYQHDVAKRAQVIKQLAHITADGAVQSRQASEEQRASIDELSRANHALAELSEHLHDVIKHFHI